MHTTAWIYHNTRPRINKYTPHEEYTSQAWLHSTTWWNTPGRIHATTLIHTTGWIQVKEGLHIMAVNTHYSVITHFRMNTWHSKNTHPRSYACLRMNTNHMNNTCHSMKPRCSMYIHHRKHSIMQLRQKQQISTSYVIKKSTQNKEIVSILFPPFGKSRPHQSTEKSPKIMLLNHSQIILDKPMEFEKVQNQRSCRNSTGF